MLHGICHVKKAVYKRAHSTTSKSCGIFPCCLNLSHILFLSCLSAQCLRGTSAEKTLLLTIFGWQQLVRQVIRGYQHHSYLLTTGVLSAQLLLVGLGCVISAFCSSSPVKQLNALMKIWLPLHKYMWAYMCLNDWPWVLCTAEKHKWKRASPGKNELPVLLYNDIIARVSQRSAWLAPCPWAIHPDTLG